MLTFSDLQRDDGGDFVAGDCFQFDLTKIDNYEKMEPGFYEPFPVDTIDCTKVTPAAACIRLDPYRIQMTLSAAAATLGGDIGPMKNPFSTTGLTLQAIRYYAAVNGGCAGTSSPTSSTDTLEPTGWTMQFEPGVMKSASVETASKVLGETDLRNVGTLKF